MGKEVFMRKRYWWTVVIALALTVHSFAVAGPQAKLNETFQELNGRCQKIVAYDLPERGREPLLKSLQTKFGAGWEFVDLSTVPEAQRGNRLGEGFVLVTTFRSGKQLLQSTLKDVGIAIPDTTHVTVDKKTVKAKALRMIFVGKNTYGPGPCIVLAARQNSDLKGLINWARYNPTSALILDGSVYITTLAYTSDFTRLSDSIPLDEALSDVATCFSKLAEIHPDPLHNVTAQDFVQMERDTKQRVIRAAGTRNRVCIRDLRTIVRRALAFIGDGHTHVTRYGGPDILSDSKKHFPPFLPRFDNGKWVVRKAVDSVGDLEGTVIESVNGQPFTKFLSPLLALISGETLAFKATWLTGSVESTWWSESHRLDNVQTLDCRFETASGRRIVKSLPIIGIRDFEKLVASARQDNLFDGSGTFRFLNDGKICVFTYPAFDYSEEEVVRIGRMFHEIKKRHTQTLIMDIRGNGGGNTAIGDILVSYLTDKPYRAFSRVISKISPEAIAQRDEYWSGEQFQIYQHLIGMTTSEEQPLEKPKPRVDRFKGNFILLTDNATFSAASDFALIVKSFHLGTVIGSETGGTCSSFGDSIFITLPYSGIGMSISYRFFVSPKPEQGDSTHGVVPDMVVTDALLAPYRNQADPVMALALHVASQAPSAP